MYKCKLCDKNLQTYDFNSNNIPKAEIKLKINSHNGTRVINGLLCYKCKNIILNSHNHDKAKEGNHGD